MSEWASERNVRAFGCLCAEWMLPPFAGFSFNSAVDGLALSKKPRLLSPSFAFHQLWLFDSRSSRALPSPIVYDEYQFGGNFDRRIFKLVIKGKTDKITKKRKKRTGVRKKETHTKKQKWQKGKTSDIKSYKFSNLWIIQENFGAYMWWKERKIQSLDEREKKQFSFIYLRIPRHTVCI